MCSPSLGEERRWFSSWHSLPTTVPNHSTIVESFDARLGQLLDVGPEGFDSLHPTILPGPLSEDLGDRLTLGQARTLDNISDEVTRSNATRRTVQLDGECSSFHSLPLKLLKEFECFLAHG